jgi:4-amino-4-deoxy-L-arabinose transferase-like glycosyltransferase
MKQATAVNPAPSAGMAQEQALTSIRALPVLLSLITLALGLIYLAVIPPWGGPDEPRHFEYVALLNLKGRTVGYEDVTPAVMIEIIRSMDAVDYWKWGVSEWKPTVSGALPTDFGEIYGEGAHQLHQPPLAYLLYLIPYKLLASTSITAQLYAMRLISILLNILVVLAAYVTGRELFRRDSDLTDSTMALAIPVFVMLLPQHIFLHSIVMNDHLVEAALAWMIALLARTFRLGLSLPRVLGMFALVGIGLATKRNALYGVAILGFAFLVYMIAHWGGGRLTVKQKSIRLASTVIALALGAVGVVWAWNWLAVNQPKFVDYFLRLFLFLPTQQFPFQLDGRVIEPAALPLYASYLKYTFISTWGHFGWMNITLGVWAYYGFALLTLAALLGLIVFTFRDFGALLPSQRGTLIVFAFGFLVALFLIVALQVRYWDLGWGGDPQGRYLFPVLIPLATLFLIGTRAFFPRVRHVLWFSLMVGAMVLYNVVVLGFFIIPFYRA